MKKGILRIMNLLLNMLKDRHLLLLHGIISNKLQIQDENQILQFRYGHLSTKEQQESIDEKGNPLPWFTYPTIEYIKQFDLANKTVFEWGSGNSSLFFASRVKSIYSVESDELWFDKVNSKKERNQQIALVPIEKYVDHILTLDKTFDIIIVDGKERQECAKLATQKLCPGGMIILDNSDWYANTAKSLREFGLIQIDMHGFGPINPYTWTTSLFLSRDFDFKTIGGIQPHYSIAAIKNKND